MASPEAELGCYDLLYSYPPDAILMNKGFGTRLLFTKPDLNNLFYIFGLSHLHFFEETDYQPEVKTSMSGFLAYGEKVPVLRNHVLYLYDICEKLVNQKYDIGSIPIGQLLELLQCYAEVIEHGNSISDLEGAVNLLSSIFHVHVVLFEHIQGETLLCKIGLATQTAPVIYLEKIGESYSLLHFQEGIRPTTIFDQAMVWEEYGYFTAKQEEAEPEAREEEAVPEGREDDTEVQQWGGVHQFPVPEVSQDLEESKASYDPSAHDDHEHVAENPPAPQEQDPYQNLLMPQLKAHRKILQLLLPAITNQTYVIPRTSELYDHLSFCFNSPMLLEDSEDTNKVYQDLFQALQTREANLREIESLGHDWRECELHSEDLQELHCLHKFCTQHIQQWRLKVDACLCPYECPESERTNRLMA